jgi:ABC-type lipopolysaccharide export system ATPase subunit
LSLEYFFDLRNQTRVEQNTTEKGRLLEQLVIEMMKSLTGVSISEHDIRTTTEEIDIVLLNLRVCDAFVSLPNDIFIECKNWSTPIGVAEIDHFIATLRRNGVDFGILVARHGVTGTQFREGQNAILQERQHKRRVIVITWENIELINNIQDIYDMIQHKFGALIIGKVLL